MDVLTYIERFYRQFKTPPILMRRALGTAIAIIRHLEKVDFTDLTFTAFAICSDGTYRDLIQPFERQLELAKVREEELVSHLHDFYLAMAKKTDKIAFFELLAFVHDRVFVMPIAEREDAQFHIYCAYYDLIIQLEEYLHPNQNDYNEHIVGIQTNGKLICKQEPLPNLDIATYEIERRAFKNGNVSVPQVFKMYGYDIQNEEDLQQHNTVLRNYDNTIAMMIPWINEYTYDILPERLIKPYLEIPPVLKNLYVPDKEAFRHRRRTLPANGVTVRIEGNPLIEAIRMKEIFHADAIYMIARIRLSIGDYVVRFNTQTGLFMSILLDILQKEGMVVHNLLASTTLWLYGSYVLPSHSGKWSDYFDGHVVINEAVGGKLRSVYGRRHDLEQSDRTINGFVRRLPEGQQASDEARERAEMLGFELGDGETYVQSFIRSAWVVKGK